MKLIQRNISLSAVISVALLIVGGMMIGQSVYMQAKAKLAQHLIAYAWHSKQENQPAAKPWPWADIQAVAKITVPRLDITQYVMNGSHGEALAFGPGHLEKTALPAQTGHSMVAGHRDSHFEFMQHLELDDRIMVSNYLGQRQQYIIKKAYRLDTRTEQLVLHPEQNTLTLITCYPFNNLAAQGPLRWIVEAVPSEV